MIGNGISKSILFRVSILFETRWRRIEASTKYNFSLIESNYQETSNRIKIAFFVNKDPNLFQYKLLLSTTVGYILRIPEARVMENSWFSSTIPRSRERLSNEALAPVARLQKQPVGRPSARVVSRFISLALKRGWLIRGVCSRNNYRLTQLMERRRCCHCRCCHRRGYASGETRLTKLYVSHGVRPAGAMSEINRSQGFN